ncbi:type II toxin-antitoxin system RelE/ParE family toxin [Luteimonas sp. RD2P54]|uniref:Toxin n=1 Tax=Luteimonas endophytica TaxID=3042023 RepID=A0ABT6J5V3_9GAMM|nr:type II toxin-antitoxin system RelE/ParE family toxin [Luteimonas endophytica]MDH5821975.1 type II toxin-antitoxin system RelE/ParE family toxin [Luteimonas endophytica]
MRHSYLTRSARSDLKSIACFTQDRWGVRQRNAYLKEMEQVFRSLARNPLIRRACDEIREGYRKLAHGAHVIYYKQPNDNELLIVRILHATMDVDTNIGA